MVRKPSNSQANGLLQLNDPPVMISACLLGVCCRYDGGHSLCPGLLDFVSSCPFMPFCPEQLGGLSTPRPPADIREGDGRDILAGRARLISDKGRDVTEAFKKGAQEALRLATMAGVKIAIMKDRSPSCGLQTPHCETPSGTVSYTHLRAHET